MTAIAIIGVASGIATLGDVIISGRESLKVFDKETTVIPVHSDLAASYGNLTSLKLKQLDDKLKTIISGTLLSMARLPDYKWDTIVSSMLQNPLLERLDDSTNPIHRVDIFTKSGTNFFKFDGSPDEGVVREVNAWFEKLISDDDVLKDTRIDIDLMADIVAQTGATIDTFLNFFAKSERHERTMIDVGVLRYPEETMPYFKLYRIKLVAWSDSTRILFYQEDKNGITGEFNCQKFKPRDSVLDEISKEVIAKAVEATDSLADSSVFKNL